jgi:ubiquinone/menaquinone biosynthesis C-methylase UbiE
MPPMKRIIVVATVIAVALAIRAWLVERGRRAAFPASDAPALLNPLRRLIQDPRRTIDAFALRRGDTVLEIGPGPGYFSPHAVDAIGATGRLICLDLQPEMLALLRDRLAEDGRRADLIAAEAGHLPLRAGVIDVAFLINVLGEVPDPSRALDEIRRATKQGGTLAVNETVNDPDYVRLSVLRELCSAAQFDALDWRRQLLGYIARFRRPPLPGDR